jgi:16S rRNA (guanine527-N7)-methyltransferase
VVDRLGLDSVHVVRSRAEELHGQTDFSFVTSRAVAPLPRLLDWSMPLVRPGGALVAMKGATAADEVREGREHLGKWGAGSTEVLSVGTDVIRPPTTVIRVEATQATRLGWDSGDRNRAARSGGARRNKRKGRPT